MPYTTTQLDTEQPGALMTPDESAVLEAAKAYYFNELMDAIRALEEPDTAFATYYLKQRASRLAAVSA